jgi:hypothetical protein
MICQRPTPCCPSTSIILFLGFNKLARNNHVSIRSLKHHTEEASLEFTIDELNENDKVELDKRKRISNTDLKLWRLLKKTLDEKMEDTGPVKEAKLNDRLVAVRLTRHTLSVYQAS